MFLTRLKWIRRLHQHGPLMVLGDLNTCAHNRFATGEHLKEFIFGDALAELQPESNSTFDGILSMSGPGCWQYLHPQLPGRQVAVYDMFRSNRFQIDFALNNKRSVPCCTMHSLAAGFLNCSNQSWHLFMPITYLAMACMQICNFAMRRMPPTTPHKVGGPSLSNLTCNIYIYIFKNECARMKTNMTRENNPPKRAGIGWKELGHHGSMNAGRRENLCRK